MIFLATCIKKTQVLRDNKKMEGENKEKKDKGQSTLTLCWSFIWFKNMLMEEKPNLVPEKGLLFL